MSDSGDRVRTMLDSPEYDEGMRQLARREIRKRMRVLRNLVPAEVVAQRSLVTCEQLDALPRVNAAKVILSYQPVRNEIDPTSLVTRALERHQQVALPRVEEDGSLSVLRYRGETLEPDLFGVLAPGPDAEMIDLASIDVVLVPALAVDDRGHRLGYGRGFYDRLLTQMPHAFAIALVHPFQVVIELADMPGDVPVSCFATEAGVVSTHRE